MPKKRSLDPNFVDKHRVELNQIIKKYTEYYGFPEVLEHIKEYYRQEKESKYKKN